MQLLNDIVSEMNSNLSNNETPSDPRTAVCGSSCYVQDTRLRVNRVALIFTQNDATYGNTDSTVNAVAPGQVINIFLRGNNLSGGGGCIPGGFATGGNIFMNNQQCSNQPASSIATNVLHEIFHVLGVNHVYQNGSCGASGSGCSCCPNCPCSCWSGHEISDVNHIDYLSDVFGNTGTHNWETYLHNSCIGNANNCIPTSNNNDNCTNNLMGWRGRFISTMQAGRIHRNAMTNARISSYMCGYAPSTPYVVQNNETWDFNIKFYQDVVVKAGKTLTVKCELNMVPGSRIIVEQNARLIVDGGLITSGISFGCNDLWQGIEVWSNASQHQYTYSGNQLYQGFVELKNGAIIENAYSAVNTSKDGDWQMQHTGGIIQATNAIFRNNRNDIHFNKYQNFNPSNPNIKRPNLSFFRNCVFETTANLNSGSNPYAHVTMWNVDGVRFYGCRFENSNPSATNLSSLGNGIYTKDAHFIVTGCDWNVTCFPVGACCNKVANIFRNLNYGIRTKYLTGSQYNYNVDNNTFNNCFVNVYNEGVNNAIITRNNHTIGRPRFASVYGTGIEFNTGSGYRIEENTFTRDPNPNVWFSLGTWMTNTGMNNNQIYKNTFSNLYYSVLAP